MSSTTGAIVSGHASRTNYEEPAGLRTMGAFPLESRLAQPRNPKKESLGGQLGKREDFLCVGSHSLSGCFLLLLACGMSHENEQFQQKQRQSSFGVC